VASDEVGAEVAQPCGWIVQRRSDVRRAHQDPVR
jgi:hypothetical protein